MFGLNLKAYLIIGAVVLTVLGGFGLYFWYAQSRIEQLASDLRAERIRTDALEKLAEELRNDMNIVRQATQELERQRTVVRNRAAVEARTLRERNLRSEVQVNPVEAQRRANEDTANAFRALEELTRQ